MVQATSTDESQTAKKPLVSVLIVSYEVAALLQACLQRLLVNGQLPDWFEIIVVDNASQDGTVGLLAAQFPTVCCIPLGQNVGFSAALNQAAKRARGQQLLLLNPDTEVTAKQLLAMSQALQQLPGAFAVGFSQTDKTGYWQLAHGRTPTLWSELQRKMLQTGLDRYWPGLSTFFHARYQTAQPVGWVAASCCLVWSEAFWLVGGFDSGYFLYFEDIDFCLRLKQFGGQVYFDPTIQVIHHRGQSAKHRPKAAAKAYRHSQMRFVQRYGGRWLRPIWWGYAGLRAWLVRP